FGELFSLPHGLFGRTSKGSITTAFHDGNTDHAPGGYELDTQFRLHAVAGGGRPAPVAFDAVADQLDIALSGGFVFPRLQKRTFGFQFFGQRLLHPTLLRFPLFLGLALSRFPRESLLLLALRLSFRLALALG